MSSLMIKEFRELFSSVIGGVIGVMFVLSVYLFLWVVPGEMNLFENGYATLDGFCRIVYILLFFTIPLWSMNSYGVEQRYGTNDWFGSLPVTATKRYLSKFIAAFLGFGVLVLITFVVYLPILLLTDSGSDIDLGVLVNSYFGMMLLVSFALSMNLFVSSKIDNSIASVIVSMLANFVLFYGVGMVCEVLQSGLMYDLLVYFDPSAYYRDWMKGVMDSSALVFFVSFVLLFVLLVEGRLWHGERRWFGLGIVGLLIGLHLFNWFFFVRIDCTHDRLYSLSPQTKRVVTAMDRPVRATLYLGGSLNSGFRKLERAAHDLLLEYRALNSGIELVQVDPSEIADFADSPLGQRWQSMGLQGVSVKETTSDGSFKQRMVYPYLELRMGDKEFTIDLLVNDRSRSGAENLNASIEQLEYSVSDGLVRLMQQTPKKIAFIEGHGEWDEPYLSGALDLLSSYYSIDRGALEGAVEPLLGYDALIIADPKSAFSTEEVFVLDQYVRHGGSILWNVSPAEIKPTGETGVPQWTASVRDLGLTELFFQYGIRINPTLIRDTQCSPIPLKMGEGADVELAPWYYSPLLRPNAEVGYLENVPLVELPFSSSIELIDRANRGFSVKRLLQSSTLSQECALPYLVSLSDVSIEPNGAHFTQSELTAAVLIEGSLPSLYANRLSPIDHRIVPSVTATKAAKVVVVANGELLKNRVTVSKDSAVQSYPLGFNPYLTSTTGNRDFVLNTVKYLCGDDELFGLTRKEIRLRLLSKSKISEQRMLVQVLALSVPLVLLGILYSVVFVVRRRRNARVG